MKRKVIPVLIGLLLIVLILAGAAGVFLIQRYSGSKEEADLNAYFGLNGSQEVAIVWNQELTEEKGLLHGSQTKPEPLPVAGIRSPPSASGRRQSGVPWAFCRQKGLKAAPARR